MCDFRLVPSFYFQQFRSLLAAISGQISDRSRTAYFPKTAQECRTGQMCEKGFKAYMPEKRSAKIYFYKKVM